MVDIKKFKAGGYCHAPETIKDYPLCDRDGCKNLPEFEFYPTNAPAGEFWWYLCREDLESIVGEIEE